METIKRSRNLSNNKVRELYEIIEVYESMIFNMTLMFQHKAPESLEAIIKQLQPIETINHELHRGIALCLEANDKCRKDKYLAGLFGCAE